MTRRRPPRPPELVFQPYVLDATALIDFERSRGLRKHLSNPGDSILVPWRVMKEVTRGCRSLLCKWVKKNRSNVVRRVTDKESALAVRLAQEFAALIDEADAEAIAIASARQAILVTGERATKIPEVATQYGVQCIGPAQFLSEWPGAGRAR